MAMWSCSSLGPRAVISTSGGRFGLAELDFNLACLLKFQMVSSSSTKNCFRQKTLEAPECACHSTMGPKCLQIW